MLRNKFQGILDYWESRIKWLESMEKIISPSNEEEWWRTRIELETLKRCVEELETFLLGVD